MRGRGLRGIARPRRRSFRSVESAWRGIDVRRPQPRPGRGRRGGRRRICAYFVALRRGSRRKWSRRPHPALSRCALLRLGFACWRLCSPRLPRPSSPPRRLGRLLCLLRRAQAFGLPFQPRLLDFPVLDLLPPSIHEPLALQTPVEESALANIGFHRGNAIALARDRLGGERSGKGADVDLPLRRL